MDELNRIINESGLSKVKIAKYLGVSRQMLYNYLALNSFEEIPKDKKSKLLSLLGVTKESELAKVKVDDRFVQTLEGKINEGTENTKKTSTSADFKGLNKKEQELLSEIFNLIKERLINNGNEGIDTLKYLYYYLQAMENMPELKYILAYMAKTNLFIPALEFAYDEDKQYTFEGILFSAMTLYNNDVAAPSKVTESHKKFEMEIESKKEEKLSRTEELNTFRIQALNELGYNTITEANAKEVFEKIAEIMSRKF